MRIASAARTAVLIVLIACQDGTEPSPLAEGLRLGISATGLVLEPGGTFQMGVNLWSELDLHVPLPDNVRWGSAEPAIVQVSGSGVLTGAAEGSTHVWVEAAGHRDSASVLVTATPELRVRQYSLIAVGGSTTCALDPESTAVCWGSDFSGQLGRERGRKFTDGLTPGPVSGGLVFDTVVNGQFHSCGIAQTAETWCWGKNNSGQLGQEGADWDDDPAGWIDGRARPVAVSGGYSFKHLSLGAYHSCGLDAQGRAYCWGWNVDGELGRGSFDHAPHPDPQPVETDLRFVELSAGRFHTCGRAADGHAYCWGLNNRGQLGASGSDLCPQGACGTAPTPVETELRFNIVAAGGQHTCGIALDDALYCWGSNRSGAAGQESSSIVQSPTPVQDAPLLRSVVSGSDFTCGLTGVGTAYCWGSNEHGQLGQGEPNIGSNPDPRRVSGDHAFTMLGIEDLHTCGLKVGGEIVCWGRNIHGALGDGTLESRVVPVSVIHP